MKSTRTYQQQLQELNGYARNQLTRYLSPEFELFNINAFQYLLLQSFAAPFATTLSDYAQSQHTSLHKIQCNLRYLEEHQLLTYDHFNLQTPDIVLTKLGQLALMHIQEVIDQHYELQWNQYNEKDKEWIMEGLQRVNDTLRYLHTKEKDNHE